jgi:hypothetical protein
MKQACPFDTIGTRLRVMALWMPLLLTCLPALARLPEPCNIYYGEARGVHGCVLTDGMSAVVVARINGAEAAEHEITAVLSTGVNFALRIPLDDGWEGRYAPNAARAGEQPEILIRYGGAQYQVDGIVPAIGDRGVYRRITVEAVPEPVAFVLCAMLGLACARRHR